METLEMNVQGLVIGFLIFFVIFGAVLTAHDARLDNHKRALKLLADQIIELENERDARHIASRHY
jgi:hypothetical protein